MKRKPFTWQDIERECSVYYQPFRVGKNLGAKIIVPAALYDCYPYNASAYHFLQTLRHEIRELKLIHFPDLPLNKTNYTLAQGAPQQHAYSTNPFMTDWYQLPHQDTPPYPTAFGLEEQRRYFATWVMSQLMMQKFYDQQHASKASLEDLHRQLVAESIANGEGMLVNQNPGLLIIDNSPENGIYHARTANFAAIDKEPQFQKDAFMYAFNEIGLLHYMEQLDSRRGTAWRDENDKQQVLHYFQHAF